MFTILFLAAAGVAPVQQAQPKAADVTVEVRKKVTFEFSFKPEAPSAGPTTPAVKVTKTIEIPAGYKQQNQGTVNDNTSWILIHRPHKEGEISDHKQVLVITGQNSTVTKTVVEDKLKTWVTEYPNRLRLLTKVNDSTWVLTQGRLDTDNTLDFTIGKGEISEVHQDVVNWVKSKK